MKVAHLCLSNFYADGHNYQENELVRQHVVDGHDVLVIASTESYSPRGEIIFVEPTEYVGKDGARVIRLPYSRWLPHKVMRKLRIHPGVYAQLEQFAPDAILFHATCGAEVVTAALYAKDHPDVIFRIDSHEDHNNSARTFLSRELLHKRYYGPLLRRAARHAGPILCISLETIDFVEAMYRIPRERLEFFPLGGRPIPPVEYTERRARKRAELGLADTEIALVQSGKQTKRKKLIESLTDFQKTPNPRLRFFVAGVLADDIRDEAEALIADDDRIQFLGWRNVDQLTDLLCAADLYLQPGTQSVTMQHSLCCHCAVAIDDVKSHGPFIDGNGWLISDNMPLRQVLAEAGKSDLTGMGQQSYALAQRILDYAILGKRVVSAYECALAGDMASKRCKGDK